MMNKPTFAIGTLVVLALAAVLTACQNPWGKLDNPTDPVSTVQARLITGPASPVNSVGTNGDLYMDTASSTMYVKISGAWTVVANLRGPTGPAGATWLTGTGAPAASLGVDGDLYLDTSAIDVYTKTAGAWGKTVNLLGATGATGATGSTGAAGTAGTDGIAGTNGATGPIGPQGAAGNIWYTGTATPPASAVGVDGDLYLNTATTQVYTKAGGAWGAALALQGPQGLQGLAGATGPQGTTGPSGPTGPQGPTGTQGPAGVSAYSPPILFTRATNSGLSDVLYKDGYYIGVGAEIYRSSDANIWVSVYASSGGNGIAFGNGLYIVISTTYVDNCYRSSDGQIWNLAATIPVLPKGIAFGNGKFIVATSNGKIFSSIDGITWIEKYSKVDDAFYAVEYLNGKFIAVGAQGFVMTSDDSGDTWSVPQYLFMGAMTSVSYGNGKYVLGSDNSLFFYSNDAISWTRTYWPSAGTNSICYGDDRFVAVGSAGGIMWSTDGVTWEPRIFSGPGSHTVIWDGSKFIATL